MVSITDSQGGVTTMAYNAAGQVTSKTYQDSYTQFRVDYTYDLAGNLLTETRYSDLAGTERSASPNTLRRQPGGVDRP